MPVLVWDAETAPHVVDAVADHGARATLASLARSVVELLGGEQRDRLRRCEGPRCVLLFVADNPRRRWCSPTACGNRVRVARHYARHGAQTGQRQRSPCVIAAA